MIYIIEVECWVGQFRTLGPPATHPAGPAPTHPLPKNQLAGSTTVLDLFFAPNFNHISVRKFEAFKVRGYI